MPDINSLSSSQLLQIVDFRKQIEALEADIQRIVSGAVVPTVNPSARSNGKPKRIMSASARERIAEAQRKRWAKVKGGKPSNKPAAKPKRTMSSEAKARIAAAQRARWAKTRAEKKA
jgi:hypothetical protein